MTTAPPQQESTLVRISTLCSLHAHNNSIILGIDYLLLKLQGTSGPYAMAGSIHLFYEARQHQIRTSITQALRRNLANLEV